MRPRSSVLTIASIFLLTGCTGSPTPIASGPPSGGHHLVAPPTLTNTLTVQGVEDGRTVLLSDGTRIRMAGLAAPEECWASAATAFAKAFLLDKQVKVDPGDPAVVDEAPLWLDDGTEYALFAVSQGVLRGDSPHDPAFVDALGLVVGDLGIVRRKAVDRDAGRALQRLGHAPVGQRNDILRLHLR